MKKAGVIGWPVAHSRSPLIHGYWLGQYGIEGSYERIAVEPEKAASFFSTFKSSGFRGANVTIPHKETVLPFVDELDPAAARIGAVNTLWMEDDRLCGGNTDVHGFLANLDASLPAWDQGGDLALVLGAGGAAKAIVDGLVRRGMRVLLANRTLEKAEQLSGKYRGNLRPILISDVNRYLSEAALVVNSTSLGMKGEGAIPVDFELAKPEAIVTDIVYVPLETAFLRAASQRGLRTVEGLGMLLHQAAPGFERWFGLRPSVSSELRAVVEADLT